MILIADSGGSKIDWRLLTFDGTVVQANTPGFNPYYQPIEDLTKNFKEVIVPRVTEGIQKIFFYGAGVSSEKNQMTIKNAFLEFFPKAQIEIGWDLLAAARALCGRDPGIACIMGTGSNSCLYDGQQIVGNVANLGWILGGRRVQAQTSAEISWLITSGKLCRKDCASNFMNVSL
jgi:N-acetylglucosamine kinase-like BadF-type ATPase